MSINKIKKLFPYWLRSFVWKSIPKLHIVNTYKLIQNKPINNLRAIAPHFTIREVNNNDLQALKKAHETRGKNAFRNKVLKRINQPEWHGLAVFNSDNGEIAYIAWVIDKSIPFFEEFGIRMKENQFLLKDIYVVPKYRRQGLNTRMEQERINYCVNNGAKEVFIQIHNSHPIMNKLVVSNGYVLYQQNYVIQWPIFHVYRSLKGFIKSPFRTVIK